MFKFLTQGRELAQHPPSPPAMAVPTLQPAQSMELDARIGCLEKKLSEECARRVELEVVEVELRQALDASQREKASLLVSLSESEEERRQLAARLVAMELPANADVEDTTEKVRGIFGKAKSEAHRLVMLIFSILAACSGYFGAKITYLKNGLSRLSKRGTDSDRSSDSMRCKVEAVRARLEEVLAENEHLRQDNCAAKGWQEKYRVMQSKLVGKEEQVDALRLKVNDLESFASLEAKDRDEEVKNATGSIFEIVKGECQRLALVKFSLFALCANLAARCKGQRAALSRKSRELRQFMNCICTLTLDIQELRKDNKKLSSNIVRLREENKEYMETIKLMQCEIEIRNNERAEAAAVEEENDRRMGEVEELKALIAVVMEKDAELNRIVERRGAGGNGWE